MGDVLATVSVAGGDRLIKSSLYRYIALQLGHFLKFPSAQFWKEQMTHQMRVVLDYWESYGKDESEPGWAIRLMTEGAFKRADLPDNPAHAVSLWIDGALWLGCDFAGPTDAQRELKHKREKILERIIAAHVENPGSIAPPSAWEKHASHARRACRRSQAVRVILDRGLSYRAPQTSRSSHEQGHERERECTCVRERACSSTRTAGRGAASNPRGSCQERGRRSGRSFRRASARARGA